MKICSDFIHRLSSKILISDRIAYISIFSCKPNKVTYPSKLVCKTCAKVRNVCAVDLRQKDVFTLRTSVLTAAVWLAALVARRCFHSKPAQSFARRPVSRLSAPLGPKSRLETLAPMLRHWTCESTSKRAARSA